MTERPSINPNKSPEKVMEQVVRIGTMLSKRALKVAGDASTERKYTGLEVTSTVRSGEPKEDGVPTYFAVDTFKTDKDSGLGTTQSGGSIDVSKDKVTFRRRPEMPVGGAWQPSKQNTYHVYPDDIQASTSMNYSRKTGPDNLPKDLMSIRQDIIDHGNLQAKNQKRVA